MSALTAWIEGVFFHPTLSQRLFSILLLPLSLLYGSIMLLRRLLTPKKRFNIPIISIGNLLVGGSGKTPFLITLSQRYENRKVYVISRGYGRASSGLVKVSDGKEILCSVAQSGDEAMLIAKQTQASVLVSEDRSEAIETALKDGAELILLDDGFNRVELQKFEILLQPPRIASTLPLPSGPFREFAFTKRFADLCLTEDREFRRKVTITNPTQKMLLVTAIANPKRLEPYLPEVVEKIYFPDHAYFDARQLRDLLRKHEAESILCTQKDLVKMDDSLPLSVLQLQLEIEKGVYETIDRYIDSYKGTRATNML